jgi:DNA-binding transcriptional MerR regulator
LREIAVPDVEIPKRSLFKSSEVCEIASVQPYVLRSWESEFPDLGVSKGNGGSRVYRRADVERVLRIKQLVFSDGLTLAGVRRKIEEDTPSAIEDVDTPPMRELLGRDARERLLDIKRGLRGILDLLSARPGEAVVREFPRGPARPAARPAARGKAPVRRVKPPARPARKTSRR